MKKDLNMIIKKYSAEFVFETFKDERIYYYEGIVKKSPSQKEFINGWKNRVRSFKYKSTESKL